MPWKTRNCWLNCLHAYRSINSTITHIFRECNHCAGKLACLGFNFHNFNRWNDVHFEINENFARNKFGLPNFRSS